MLYRIKVLILSKHNLLIEETNNILNLLKITSVLTFSIIVTALTTFIKTKMYAVYLGPSGLVIFSQIFNFSVLFSSLIHFGVPLGLSTIFPKLLNETESYDKIYSYLKFFSKLIIFFVTGVVIVITIFSKDITELLVDDSQYYIAFCIILISVPFVVLYNLIEPLLKAKGMINVLVKITILSNVLTLPLLILLIIYFGITGVSIYIFIFNAFPLILYLLFFDRTIVPNVIKSNRKIDVKIRASILKIGLISLLSSFMFQFSLIFIRKFSISNLGFENAGIYQSLISLSSNYFMFIYIFLSNYSLPKLSTFNTTEEICLELNNNFRLLVFIIVPIIVLIFTYKNFVINLIFSPSFSTASNYIGYQLIGDIFRAFAALFGLWMIPRQKLKILFIIDFSMNICFIIFPLVLFGIFKMEINSLSITYLFSFFVHFVLYYLYTRKQLNFRFSRQNSYNIFISGAVIILVFLLSIYFPSYAFYFAPIGLLIWVYLYLETSEQKAIINKIIYFSNRKNW